VILSVILFIVGLLWFKQFRFAGGTDLFQVDFEAVDALQVRDRVQVRGIRMGTVKELQIVDDFVRVTVNLDKAANLRQDARFRLQTIGIVGEKVIEIDPGRGEPVLEGHIFKGESEPSLSSMGGVASEAMDELRDLARDVRRLIGDLREEGRVTETLQSTRSAAEGLGELVHDNRAGIRELVRNIQQTSAALREAIAGPDSVLAKTAAGASQTFAHADSVLGQLEKVAISLGDIVARLEAGQGTAGRLLTNEGLYARAESTLASIEELVDDIRRDPRKFFKFSVIDF
jgi:phospholipid/cholesterol/gamma-HCH transport system substrate-binding protein